MVHRDASSRHVPSQFSRLVGQRVALRRTMNQTLPSLVERNFGHKQTSLLDAIVFESLRILEQHGEFVSVVVEELQAK